MARKPRTNSAAPAEGGIGHNSEGEKAANRAQLLSYVAKLNPALDVVDGLKAQVKTAQSAVTTIFRLAKASGFPRGALEDLIADIRSRDTPAQQDREKRRIEWRRIFNLPVGETDELDLKMPQEARDEVYYATEGHRAGLTGLPRELPPGIAPRMDQIWLRNYDKGSAEFVEISKANAPKPMTSVAEKAAADFAEDEAAARKAANKVKESDFMKTGGPDAFEATEDELAAQAGRPSAAEDIIE